MNKAEIHANRREDYETPRHIFDPLNAIFGFVFDLAANASNTLCEHWIGPGSAIDDLLAIDATRISKLGGGWMWINPPYGRHLKPFTRQVAALANLAGWPILALLPANIDAGWFHDNVIGHATIFCRRGRIQFLLDGKRPMRRCKKTGKMVPNSNSGANILAVYGKLTETQEAALNAAGWVRL